MKGERFPQPSVMVLVGLLLALVAGAIPSSLAQGPGGDVEPAMPLQAPENVQATDCTYSDRVSISWDSVYGAGLYRVGRATSSTGTKEQVCIVSAPTTSCSDTTATPNAVYYYSVQQYNSVGHYWSNYSDPDTGIRKGPRPSPPSMVKASDGTNADYVYVEWSRPVGTTYYRVFRSLEAASGFQPLESTSRWWHRDSTAQPGTYYWYAVITRDRCEQWSVLSAADRGHRLAVPSPPTGVQASDCTYSDRVRITWNSVEGATSYEIWRGEGPEIPQRIATVTDTTYDDTSVVLNVLYLYRVKACNAAGCSNPSSPVPGTSCGVTLSPPTGVQASNCTYSDRVRVSWNSVEGATSYEVWRGRSGEIPDRIATTSETTYDDTSVLVNVVHYYGVKACNTVGCSDLSSPVPGARCEGANRAYLPLILCQEGCLPAR